MDFIYIFFFWGGPDAGFIGAVALFYEDNKNTYICDT